MAQLISCSVVPGLVDLLFDFFHHEVAEAIWVHGVPPLRVLLGSEIFLRLYLALTLNLVMLGFERANRL